MRGIRVAAAAIGLGCTGGVPPGDSGGGPEALELTLDGPAVTGTALEGVVEDPQFADGEFDLGTQPSTTVVACGAGEVSIEIGPSAEFVFGGNDVLATFTLQDGVPVAVEASLFQFADFNAYGSEFSRTQPATSGSFALAGAAGLCGAEAVLFGGTFAFVTEAGAVSGTFLGEAPAAP